MAPLLTPVGIGLDLVDLDRFRKLYDCNDIEILHRCFTDEELLAAGSGVDRFDRLAAKFAAKEAAYKALGGPVSVALTDIVVLPDVTGKPTIALHGKAQEVSEAASIKYFLVSYTHSEASAAAVVIALSAVPK